MLVEHNRLISGATLCGHFSIQWRHISNLPVYCCVFISEITLFKIEVDAKDGSNVLSPNSVYFLRKFADG